MRVIFLGVFFFIFCAGVIQAQNPKSQAWKVKGDTLLNRQDFKGAIKYYSKIIAASKQKDGFVYEAIYKRAVCFYSLGDFESALKDIDIFIPANLSFSQAHLLRAFIYRELRDNEKQLIDLQAAISLRPNDPDLLKWRATLFLDKGEYLLAKLDILEARKSQTDSELETYLGLVYYNLNYPDSALIALNKSIELDVNYLPAYFYAASFCLQEEHYNLALKYVNVALRLDPKNSTALFYKGVALVEKKDLDEGCSCLNKAFYLGYDDAGDYLKEYCYEVED